MPMRFATSSASESCVSRTYAFFWPSGRMSVFTLLQEISYMALTASLICRLFAATSTINTKGLLSSIFFIALSVVKGYLMTRYLSIFARAGAAFNAYLGAFGGWKLLGR